MQDNSDGDSSDVAGVPVSHATSYCILPLKDKHLPMINMSVSLHTQQTEASFLAYILRYYMRQSLQILSEL